MDKESHVEAVGELEIANAPTEKLLEEIYERSLLAKSEAECQEILSGLAQALYSLRGNENLTEWARSKVDAAGDIASVAAISGDRLVLRSEPINDGLDEAYRGLVGLSIRSEQDYPPASPERVRHVEIGTGPSILTARRDM